MALTQVQPQMAAGGPAFSAYQSSAQTLSGATFTKIQLQSESWDTNNNFDSSTNYRFTPTVAGYYQINGAMYCTSSQIGVVVIYRNGAAYKQGYQGTATGFGVSGTVYLNGSTDYVELYGYLASGGTLLNSATQYTWLDGAMIRSA